MMLHSGMNELSRSFDGAQTLLQAKRGSVIPVETESSVVAER